MQKSQAQTPAEDLFFCSFHSRSLNLQNLLWDWFALPSFLEKEPYMRGQIVKQSETCGHGLLASSHLPGP